jgi:hypothetical protein
MEWNREFVSQRWRELAAFVVVVLLPLGVLAYAWMRVSPLTFLGLVLIPGLARLSWRLAESQRKVQELTEANEMLRIKYEYLPDGAEWPWQFRERSPSKVRLIDWARANSAPPGLEAPVARDPARRSAPWQRLTG